MKSRAMWIAVVVGSLVALGLLFLKLPKPQSPTADAIRVQATDTPDSDGADARPWLQAFTDDLDPTPFVEDEATRWLEDSRPELPSYEEAFWSALSKWAFGYEPEIPPSDEMTEELAAQLLRDAEAKVGKSEGCGSSPAA